jgi:uncharacterized BrkB/YihY/UPF0761 family membrane protein
MMFVSITALYLAAGVFVAAAAPAIITALTADPAKRGVDDSNKLGLIALFWPIAVVIASVTVLVRTLGWLGHNIPKWLGAAASWAINQSTSWTTNQPIGDPTNDQPTSQPD